jgi:hypothetical protein
VRLVSAAERDRLLETCQREAAHLEMRDAYALRNEAERLARFAALGRRDDANDAPDRRRWLGLIHGLVSTGRQVRRARIVSEPVSDYIRYEYAGTYANVEAGEQVAWLPRRLASAIALPGNDFWLFDNVTVVFTVFTGSGDVLERQLTTDPAAVDLCGSAFEAVWTAATPHDRYTPH